MPRIDLLLLFDVVGKFVCCSHGPFPSRMNARYRFTCCSCTVHFLTFRGLSSFVVVVVFAVRTAARIGDRHSE